MVHGYIYSQPAVEAILLEELAASRPVYVSGSGHAFVCDGNDARGFLHINWGWNGRSNGYYAVSVLAPQLQGTGATSQCYQVGDMIVGISKPRTGDKAAPEAELLAFSFSHIEGNRFALTAAQYYLAYGFGGYYDSYSVRDDHLNDCQVGLKAKDLASGGETIVRAEHANYTSEITAEVNLPDGNYSLFPVYRKDDSDDWHTLWSVEGKTAVVRLNVSGGRPTYQNYSVEAPKITVESAKADIDMVKGITLDMTVSASEGSIHAAMVYVSLYGADGNTFAVAEFPNGAYVDVPEGMSRSFHLTTKMQSWTREIPEDALMTVSFGDVTVVDKQPVKVKSHAFAVSEDTKWMRCMKKAEIDADNDGYVTDEEIAQLEMLVLDDPGVSSLSEIEIPFPKVYSLSIKNCQEMERVDIKDFSSAISLFGMESCTNVSKVDLSASREFYSLSFYDCPKLSELIMPKSQENIYSVSLCNTGFESFDLSEMTNLNSIYVWNNSVLTTLRFPAQLNSYKEGDLWIYQNPALTSLDLSAFKGLNWVNLYENALENLTLPEDCSSITTLDLNSNRLADFDFSRLVNLRSLIVRNNPLQELDLSALKKLEYLDCGYMNLSYLDLSGPDALKTVWFEGNPMLFFNAPSSVVEFSGGGNFFGTYSEIDFSDAVVHGMDLGRITEISGATLTGNKLIRNDNSFYVSYYYLPYEGAPYAVYFGFYDENCTAEFEEESISLKVGETKTITLREKGDYFAIGRVDSENEDILKVEWSRMDDDQGHHIVPVTITRLAPGDCHVIIKDFGGFMRAGDRLLVTDTDGINDISADSGRGMNRRVYDMTGRPATSAPKRGIYIRGGKKFIVR